MRLRSLRLMAPTREWARCPRIQIAGSGTPAGRSSGRPSDGLDDTLFPEQAADQRQRSGVMRFMMAQLDEDRGLGLEELG